MEITALRAVFTSLIAQETRPARRAQLQLLREYFTNPAFRQELEQLVGDLNEPREAWRPCP